MENKKPVIIEIEDFKNELIQITNNALQNRGIPCYFLELIVKDIARELQISAKNELTMAKEKVKEIEANQTKEVKEV